MNKKIKTENLEILELDEQNFNKLKQTVKTPILVQQIKKDLLENSFSYQKCEENVVLSDDRKICSSISDKWGSVLTTKGTKFGTYFYEIEVLEFKENQKFRFGFSKGLGDFCRPIGSDEFSVGFSSDGNVFQNSEMFFYCSEEIHTEKKTENCENFIQFFLNGKDLPKIRNRICDGYYYPEVSIFKKAKIKIILDDPFSYKPEYLNII